jgi:hypothetical protein
MMNEENIVDVIGSRIPLKKVGDDYISCCPFHKEKTPSFCVSEEKQFYFCVGCGVHGDSETFKREFDPIDTGQPKDWKEFVRSFKLEGIEKLILQHCSIYSWDFPNITLSLEAAQQPFISSERIESLRIKFSQHYNRSVFLSILVSTDGCEKHEPSIQHTFKIDISKMDARWVLEQDIEGFSPRAIQELRERAFQEDGQVIESLNEKIEELEAYIFHLEKRLSGMFIHKQ